MNKFYHVIVVVGKEFMGATKIIIDLIAHSIARINLLPEPKKYENN